MAFGALRMALLAAVAVLAALAVVAAVGLGRRALAPRCGGCALGAGFRRLNASAVAAKSAGQRSDRDLLARGPLDIAQIAALVGGAEGDRNAIRAGARGAADAVDILLGNVGQVEIDDVADARDVDPARGDVGRDEDRACRPT